MIYEWMECVADLNSSTVSRSAAGRAAKAYGHGSMRLEPYSSKPRERINSSDMCHSSSLALSAVDESLDPPGDEVFPPVRMPERAEGSCIRLLLEAP